MSKFLPQLFKRLRHDRLGAITVEYFILLAFLGLGGIGVVTAIKSSIGTVGDELKTKVGELKESKFQGNEGPK
jgi:Flp pilus assembly pilin Flp